MHQDFRTTSSQLTNMSSCFSVDNWTYNSFPITPNSSDSGANSSEQLWNEAFIMTTPPTSVRNISLEISDQRCSPISDLGPCMNDLNFFSHINHNTSMNKGVGHEAICAELLEDFSVEKNSGYPVTSENQIPVFENVTSEIQRAQLNSFLRAPYLIPTMIDCGLSPETLSDSMTSSWNSINIEPESIENYSNFPAANDCIESDIQPISFQSATLEQVRHEQGPGQEKGQKRAESQDGNCLRFVPGNTVYLPCSGKKCDFEGCGKKFVRQEHLKRHQRTHYNSDRYDCPFCHRPFSRFDNLMAHIKLHDKGGPDRPNRRTQYFKGAANVIENLTRKRQKRINTKKSTAMERKQREK